MALSQLFWDVLMPWNLKSTYFSLKMIHFLSLNIWYVIYVVFWIKYWNLKLPHHCILFLFTICTVSQLFWNRVCTRWSIYFLFAGSITPTVELNGLAMKRGEPAIYRPLDPKPIPNYRANYNFRGMFNQRYVLQPVHMWFFLGLQCLWSVSVLKVDIMFL